MDKKLIVLAFLAVACATADLRAQAPSAFATPSAPLPATTLRARGTIEKFDTVTRTLELSTPSGTLKFPVAPATRIRRGGQNVDSSELPNLAGDRATVRYTESGGHKTVESVHVFGK
jgi:hypothetical protein